jgi:YspA, cpYpsA-related SLOG family
MADPIRPQDLPPGPWFRVLVTGSRSWRNSAVINAALGELLGEHRKLTVVHGACPLGADVMAQEWVVNAFRYSNLGIVNSEPHPANWARYGRAAGFRRNAEMVALGADLCLAFIRGGSHGATHCAEMAEKAGILVRRITDG